MILAFASTGGPLLPGRREAQQWALHELSDPVYADHRPGLLSRALTWLLNQLQDLSVPSGLGRSPGLLALVVVAVVVLVVVRWRLGPVRRTARAGSVGSALGDSRLDAAGHRALADRAADEGDWATAVRERFRAVVRALEERAVLDESPGRTAHEVSTAAGRALPTAAVELEHGARIFDDVCYGGRPATSSHDEALRSLDHQVARAVEVPA